MVQLEPQHNEIGAMLAQLRSWKSAGVTMERVAVLARRNKELHALRHACELAGVPVRLMMPGKGPGRLIRVRECAALLERLEELGSETVLRSREIKDLRSIWRFLRDDYAGPFSTTSSGAPNAFSRGAPCLNSSTR